MKSSALLVAVKQVGQRGRVLDCNEADTIFEIKEVDADGGIMLVVPVDSSAASEEAWIFEGKACSEDERECCVSSKRTEFVYQ